jgi:signal transduction histidine kinase
MLEATSIQAGGIRISPEAVDLQELLARTLRRLEPLALARSVQMESRIPEGLPPAQADATRIEQVLTNLLENTLKHGAGGRVIVEVEPLERELRVSVTDQGPGIPAQDRQRIFGFFERGAETRARGSGLGLFIAKALVEAHGGRIGVEAGPEGGACFYFTLPRELS